MKTMKDSSKPESKFSSPEICAMCDSGNTIITSIPRNPRNRNDITYQQLVIQCLVCGFRFTNRTLSNLTMRNRNAIEENVEENMENNLNVIILYKKETDGLYSQEEETYVNEVVGFIKHPHHLVDFLKEHMYQLQVYIRGGEYFDIVQTFPSEARVHCMGKTYYYRAVEFSVYREGVEIDYECNRENNTFRITIASPKNMKFSRVTDDAIYFDTEYGYQIAITHRHDSDCCEYNYLDFSNVDGSLISLIDSKVITIDSVVDYGIRINNEGVPGYSNQNGFYSNEVGVEILKVYEDGDSVTIFVSEEIPVAYEDEI